MEPALHLSRSDLAFEQLPEPVLVVDEGGRLDRVNAAAAALFGGRARRAVEQRARVADVLPWLADAVGLVLAGAGEARVEVRADVVDGVRTLAARVRPLAGAGGPSGAVALVEDVTARRASEERRRYAERLDALGTLAAGVAHEVTNPLACVVAGLSFVASEHERLADGLPAAELGEVQAALGEARAAALRVGRVVRSLERLGLPALPLAAPVDLVAVVRGAVHDAARGPSQRVVVHLGGPAPVRASEALLAEVVGELLAAALASAAEVHVAACATAGCARLVVTCAAAAGRVRPRPEPALTVCHGLVSALGGALRVEEVPGEGTRAVVTLPLASPEDVAEAPPSAAAV